MDKASCELVEVSDESTPPEVLCVVIQPPIVFGHPSLLWIRGTSEWLTLQMKRLPNQILYPKQPCTIPRRARPTSIFKIRGDGNCFYRSIAFILCGDQGQFQLVKDAIIAFLYTFQEKMGLTQKQIEIFAENCVWANYRIIRATATLFNIRVCIYSAFNGEELVPKRWLEFFPMESLAVGIRASGGIYLHHEDEQHYDVVLEVQREDSSLPSRDFPLV